MPRSLTLLLLIVVLLACQRPAAILPDIHETQLDWTEDYHRSLATELQYHYTRNAGLFLNGQFIQSNVDIGESLAALDFPLKRTTTIDTLRHDDQRYFQLGTYEGWKKKDGTLAYLVAWEHHTDEWLRTVEVIFPLHITNTPDLSEIDEARRRWEALSNAHDHPALVSELYGDSGLYFNNGHLARGTAEISDQYAYMSRPNWQIELIGKHVLPVQDDLVFEVGQYRSSGIGHYLIIWKRDSEGQWKVWLDFNY